MKTFRYKLHIPKRITEIGTIPAETVFDAREMLRQASISYYGVENPIIEVTPQEEVWKEPAREKVGAWFIWIGLAVIAFAIAYIVIKLMPPWN